MFWGKGKEAGLAEHVCVRARALTFVSPAVFTQSRCVHRKVVDATRPVRVVSFVHRADMLNGYVTQLAPRCVGCCHLGATHSAVIRIQLRTACCVAQD
jgi:hypothetical protein